MASSACFTLLALAASSQSLVDGVTLPDSELGFHFIKNKRQVRIVRFLTAGGGYSGGQDRKDEYLTITKHDHS